MSKRMDILLESLSEAKKSANDEYLALAYEQHFEDALYFSLIRDQLKVIIDNVTEYYDNIRENKHD